MSYFTSNTEGVYLYHLLESFELSKSLILKSLNFN
jgi:hypothetical protein